jgi:hypothetical protein
MALLLESLVAYNINGMANQRQFGLTTTVVGNKDRGRWSDYLTLLISFLNPNVLQV